MHATRAPHATLIAFVVYTVAGGANSVAIKFVLVELEPFWAAGTRFLAAGAVLILLALAWRRSLPTRRQTVGAVLFAMFGAGLGTVLIYVGLQEAPAALAVLFLALVPLLTMLLGSLQGVEAVSSRGLVGAVVAFLGIVVIVLDQLTLNVSAAAMAALFVGSVSLAQGGLVVKRFPPGDPIAANAVGMTVAGLVLVLISIVIGEARTIPDDISTWAAMAYLVLPGSVAMFVLALYILHRWSASATAHAFLLYPFVSASLAWILLDEPIRSAYLIGGALVVAGLYFGVLRPAARPAHASR